MGSPAPPKELTHKQTIKRDIRAALRREREHLRMMRYHIKHKSYNEALRLLAWAATQRAYAEGLKKGLGDG